MPGSQRSVCSSAAPAMDRRTWPARRARAERGRRPESPASTPRQVSPYAVADAPAPAAGGMQQTEPPELAARAPGTCPPRSLATCGRNSRRATRTVRDQAFARVRSVAEDAGSGGGGHRSSLRRKQASDDRWRWVIAPHGCRTSRRGIGMNNLIGEIGRGPALGLSRALCPSNGTWSTTVFLDAGLTPERRCGELLVRDVVRARRPAPPPTRITETPVTAFRASAVPPRRACARSDATMPRPRTQGDRDPGHGRDADHLQSAPQSMSCRRGSCRHRLEGSATGCGRDGPRPAGPWTALVGAPQEEAADGEDDRDGDRPDRSVCRRGRVMP